MALEEPKRAALQARWGVASLLFLLVLAIASVPGAENEDAWEFLGDFRHVEGAIRPVDDGHVAALFYHANKRLTALVIFPSSCDAQRCSLDNPVAYSVVNEKGVIVRSHENNGEESLLRKFLTSASAAFAAA